MFRAVPELGHKPGSVCRHTPAPGTGRGWTVLREFHPNVCGQFAAVWTEPPGGIRNAIPRVAHPLQRLRPRRPSARTRASPTTTRFFSVAQSFTDIPWSRTWRLTKKALLPGALLEHSKPLSRHCALQVTTQRVGKLAALSVGG